MNYENKPAHFGQINIQTHYIQDLIKYIIEGNKIILKNNPFQFNNINYIQALGSYGN